MKIDQGVNNFIPLKMENADYYVNLEKFVSISGNNFCNVAGDFSNW